MEAIQAIRTSAEVRDEYLREPETLVISNDGVTIRWKNYGDLYEAPAPTPKEIAEHFNRLSQNPALSLHRSFFGDLIFFLLMMGSVYAVGMGWMILMARLSQ